MTLLLDYLSRHNRDVADLVGDCEEEVWDKILHTWLQFAPRVEVPEDVEFGPGMSVDELVSLALEVEDRLLSTYEMLSRTASSPEAGEFFANLYTSEMRRRGNFARNVNELKDP